MGTKIPGLAFGYAVHTGAGVATGDGVAWYVQQGPDNDPDGPHFAPTPDIMRLTATLKPAKGGGTEVSVAIQPVAGTDVARFERLLTQRPAIAGMFRSITSEQVDAALTNRAFNFANVRQNIAVAMISMLPEIRKSMDKAGDEFEHRDRETVENAYRADGHSDPYATTSSATAAPANPWQ